ncbi:MAG: tRNA dihydrouridine synthase DusB [Desulfobacteraceae bacterium]
MKIGTVELKTPTIFAPLAGISNLPLRLLAKESGCGLVCSEMVSAYGLAYGSVQTFALLASTPREKPLSVQIFGSDATIMAAAAEKVAAAGADVVDINFGCSVRKILKSGSGAALMREPAKAAEIIQAVRGAVRVPLTVKMRSGWDASGGEALDLARIAQDSGVDAITIHPRTARQGFGGCADWSLIGRLKAALKIPVVGNGDIVEAADALRMMAGTGCDAVMVGRAAMANPLIFAQIEDLMAGRPPRPASAEARIEMMVRYLDASVRHLGEKRACFMMRSRLAWLAKGLPQAGRFRRSIRLVTTHAEARQLIDAYAQGLHIFPERGPMPN